MEESRPPPPTTPLERMKKGFVGFGASVEEGFEQAKASVVGFAKKLTAKTEEDATAADMQTAKMQVAAADRAADIKNRVH